MIDFFNQIGDLFILPLEFLSDGADALNSYRFDDSLMHEYLGYMHYAMGTPLFMLFSTVSVIFIAASLWSFVIKAVNWIVEMIPGA